MVGFQDILSKQVLEYQLVLDFTAARDDGGNGTTVRTS